MYATMMTTASGWSWRKSSSPGSAPEASQPAAPQTSGYVKTVLWPDRVVPAAEADETSQPRQLILFPVRHACQLPQPGSAQLDILQRVSHLQLTPRCSSLLAPKRNHTGRS